MTRSRRLAALLMLTVAALAVLAPPAAAAPTGVVGSVSLRNLTLPAGGDPTEEGLPVFLFGDQDGWADQVTLTIDTSRVAVAQVEIEATAGGKCSAGPVVRCVLPGPHRIYKRPADGTFLISAYALVHLTITLDGNAAPGDSGTWSVRTKVDDSPATTETATIRVGEGVNLTAVDDKPRTVAPGGAVELRPRVRNSGPAVVDGLTAVISADEDALAGTNFGNCTYGYSISCTFDTTLTPGDTYRMSAPFTIQAPRDAVGGSQATLSVQWLTAAEWQDWQADTGDPADGRPGTGPDLTLDEVAVSSAAAVQADTDSDDNGSYTTVSVSGPRTDLVAVGATIPGTPGDHRIEVGLVNRGPGTLRYPPFGNNLPYLGVTLPVGVAVLAADERCRPLYDPSDLPPSAAPDEPAGHLPAEYVCTQPSVVLRPGLRLTYAFTVRAIRTDHEETGSVVIDQYGLGDGIDRDQGNDQAAIVLSAAGGGGGLPITGTAAAATAGGGLLLLLAGVAVVAALRRSDAHRDG